MNFAADTEWRLATSRSAEAIQAAGKKPIWPISGPSPARLRFGPGWIHENFDRPGPASLKPGLPGPLGTPYTDRHRKLKQLILWERSTHPGGSGEVTGGNPMEEEIDSTNQKRRYCILEILSVHAAGAGRGLRVRKIAGGEELSKLSSPPRPTIRDCSLPNRPRWY